MMTDVLCQGRYRIERPLGAGAMGTVVLALDTVLDRRVAVKVLAGHLAADDAFRQRFLREAQLAARLCHPNIVQVFDAGHDGEPFLVMEYVDGETVADRLARGPRFSPDEVVALARDLSSGLAQAHALGIVHRDVKPHNVLLTGDGLAKLTDFGIARALEDRGLTEIGTVLGTARFMAPEQAAGHPVGPAADIFALGAVLRYAAGGALPPALAALVDAASALDPAARPTAAVIHERLATLDDATMPIAVPAPTELTVPAPTKVAVPAPTQIGPVEARWQRPPLWAAVTAVAIVVLALVLMLLPLPKEDTTTPVPPAPNAAQEARDLASWLRDQAP